MVTSEPKTFLAISGLTAQSTPIALAPVAFNSSSAYHEPLANMIRRFGSSQIRTQATLAGNLCTASPIGDGAPCLMALNAEVKIATFSGIKNIAVEISKK